jgi:xanthine dehydrogenase accessory factor
VWDWLHRAREMAASGPFVIVTIAEAAGSAPREVGAKMLISDTLQYGTIGGGNLEYKVTDQARKFLVGEGPEYRFQTYALGPLLEQCCGGNVTILLERIEPGAEFLLERRHGFLKTRFLDGALQKDWVDHFSLDPLYFQDAAGNKHDGKAVDATAMLELVARAPHRLYMFGAGHVGRAVALAVASLPFDVTWVDARESEFPAHIPVNHTKHVADDYCAFVDEAPAGALYLIFSHNHQRDYALAAKILARADAAYCGMIGSKTKRARFEAKMLKSGVVDKAAFASLTCPIGVTGISGKEPAVIAASVAAELLQVITRKLPRTPE